MGKKENAAPYEKNAVLTVSITDIGQHGEGIGRTKEGYTLFVKDAVVGDTVKAGITKAKKNYAYARLLYIEQPSPFRVEPPCPVYRQCGGCQLQALSYEKQLAYKQNKVRGDLIRLGGFSPQEVDAAMRPIVGMEKPYRYRNKAQVPVGERGGEPVAGFYAGHTHCIVPMTDCLIGAPENQTILQTVLRYMKEYHVPAYREETGEGVLRHVLIRTGARSGQIMVCLIANAEKLPHETALTEALAALPGMTSISLNINCERTNVILGRKLRVLWGKGTIEDTLRVFRAEEQRERYRVSGDKMNEKSRGSIEAEGIPDGRAEISDREKDAAAPPYVFRETGEEVRFSISPLSFYQVNPRQTEKLYSLALAFAGLTGEEIVWDLYCGIGTISLFLARHAKEVWGVEVVPEAIADARENAARNGITNARFEVGKAEEVLPAYCARQRAAGRETAVDVIVVDPPRAGCAPACLETMLAVQPRRIVYVSCDPATLARDLKVLAAGGYRMEKWAAVDQFGNTVHVETIVLLQRETL